MCVINVLLCLASQDTPPTLPLPAPLLFRRRLAICAFGYILFRIICTFAALARISSDCSHPRPRGTNTNIIFTSFNLMRGSTGVEGGEQDEVGTGGQGGRIKNMAKFVVCFCFTFYFTCCCWRPGVLPCVRPLPAARPPTAPYLPHLPLPGS